MLGVQLLIGPDLLFQKPLNPIQILHSRIIGAKQQVTLAAHIHKHLIILVLRHARLPIRYVLANAFLLRRRQTNLRFFDTSQHLCLLLKDLFHCILYVGGALGVCGEICLFDDLEKSFQSDSRLDLTCDFQIVTQTLQSDDAVLVADFLVFLQVFLIKTEISAVGSLLRKRAKKIINLLRSFLLALSTHIENLRLNILSHRLTI